MLQKNLTGEGKTPFNRDLYLKGTANQGDWSGKCEGMPCHQTGRIPGMLLKRACIDA